MDIFPCSVWDFNVVFEGPTAMRVSDLQAINHFSAFRTGKFGGRQPEHSSFIHVNRAVVGRRIPIIFTCFSATPYTQFSYTINIQ
jgi:hypothetical protein